MVNSPKEIKCKKCREEESKRILKEIEDSFCNAGYEVLSAAIDCLEQEFEERIA